MTHRDRLRLTVITGFLGSGKTTLLRRALGDGRLTAPRSRVAIAGHKFNLAFRHQRTLDRMSASEEPAPFKPFFAAHAISGLGSESPGVCYKAWAEPGL